MHGSFVGRRRRSKGCSTREDIDMSMSDNVHTCSSKYTIYMVYIFCSRMERFIFSSHTVLGFLVFVSRNSRGSSSSAANFTLNNHDERMTKCIAPATLGGGARERTTRLHVSQRISCVICLSFFRSSCWPLVLVSERTLSLSLSLCNNTTTLALLAPPGPLGRKKRGAQHVVAGRRRPPAIEQKNAFCLYIYVVVVAGRRAVCCAACVVWVVESRR